MMVIKKDGRLDGFNIQKVITSILNATNASKAMVNESDIKIIAEDIEKLLIKIRGEYGNTSSYEITGIVIDILKRDGFDDVIHKYLDYKE